MDLVRLENETTLRVAVDHVHMKMKYYATLILKRYETREHENISV